MCWLTCYMSNTHMYFPPTILVQFIKEPALSALVHCSPLFHSSILLVLGLLPAIDLALFIASGDLTRAASKPPSSSKPSSSNAGEGGRRSAEAAPPSTLPPASLPPPSPPPPPGLVPRVRFAVSLVPGLAAYAAVAALAVRAAVQADHGNFT